MSSGICGDADETTKQMLKTVELLRFKYKFQGYVHFKCLPGTSQYLLKEAVKLSDRISVNVEAPTKQHLEEIAEQKNYNTDILSRQKWLKSIRIRHNHEAKKVIHDHIADSNLPPHQEPKKRKNENRNSFTDGWVDDHGIERRFTGYKKIRWDGAPILNSGQTTQMVLGAGSENDYDILKRLDWEYKEIDLRRGYFSAFSPIEGTPLEKQLATPLAREHRLYQTDWLLRLYHIRLPEIKAILTNEDNLQIGDPKIFLADEYFGENGFVDPNTASRADLLRVPGIGIKSTNRILQLRRNNIAIKSREQLHSIGVVLKRADSYLKINGYRQNKLDRFLKRGLKITC